MPLKPYVVRQGDYLAKVAHQLGFDAEAIWGDPKNEDLKKTRDPSMLLPGDVLYVPEETPKPDLSVHEGDDHEFQAKVPEVTVSLVLRDGEGPIADEPYVINGLGDPIEGSTDADGGLTFTASVLIREVELVLKKRNVKYPVLIGDMDPLEERSGAKKRFDHLGFRDPDGVPILGNGVDVGAGAVLIGRIHVGDGAQIAPNSVVMSDIPAGARVAGVPASVVTGGG